MYGSIIMDILNIIFWPIALALLGLVYAFQYLFNWLGGSWLFSSLLHNNELNILWTTIAILGGFILISSIAVLIVKSMFSNNLSHHINRGIFASLCLVFVWVVLPILIISFITFIGGVVNLIFNGLQLNDVSFAQLAKMIGYAANGYNNHINEPWNTAPDWSQFNVFMCFIGAGASAWILFKFCEILIYRMFTILMLWFTFPFISAQIVYENNSSKLLSWKDEFLTTVWTLFITIFAMMTFMILTPLVFAKAYDSFNGIAWSGYVWFGFVVIWVIAGGRSVYNQVGKITQILSSNNNPYINTSSAWSKINNHSIARNARSQAVSSAKYFGKALTGRF